MHKIFRRPVKIGIIITVVTLCFAVALANVYPQATNIYEKIKVMNEMISLINKNYVEPVEWDEVMDGAFRGLLEKLDPHSSYIPKKKFQEVNEPFKGKFDGIGIEFDILGGYITVIAPVPGSPSEKVGIRSGDQFIEIEGESAYKITKEEVFKKLRGPRGTSVNVTVRRRGVKDSFEVNIVRGVIPIFSVTSSFMINETTGYIRLSRFSATTSDEIDNALNKLKSQGMSQLLFDLRTNSGGYLEQAVAVADQFITTQDTLVYTKGRIRSSHQVFQAHSNVGYGNFPLIILLDRWSASASEIVSGAVQDLDRGLIVGETSFGKGLVQRQWSLSDGSAVRVTIARYYTPSGRLIQRPYENGKREYYRGIGKKDREEILDSLKSERPVYWSKSGRAVYGGGGITPDIHISYAEYSDPTFKVLRDPKRLAFNWASDYAVSLRDTKISRNEFIFSYEIPSDAYFQFLEYVKNQGLEIDNEEINQDNEYIKNILKAEIAGLIWDKEAKYQVKVAGDNVIREAIIYLPEAEKFLN
jgi:carboxyl-terminal processing protease|tara:strand:- start:57935 stop:59518 length:1584 start_codon:yes stop_codon:yes gene_type:complete